MHKNTLYSSLGVPSYYNTYTTSFLYGNKLSVNLQIGASFKAKLLNIFLSLYRLPAFWLAQLVKQLPWKSGD